MNGASTDSPHEQARTPAILILGMHRSGTSACARLLRGMGIQLGPENELLPPNEENPLGYFEHRDLVRANQILLVGEHASWLQALDYGSPAFDPGQVPDSVREEFEALARPLVERLSLAGPWALKDPRLCLTLPRWLPLLTRPVCIHVIRHPIAVGLSLERRGAMPVPAGVALWELYQRRVLSYTRNLPVCRIHFETLVQDPGRCAAAIRAFLSTHAIQGVAEPSELVLSSAVDSQLVHHHGAIAAASELLNASQMDLLQRLQSDEYAPAETPELSWGAQLILAHHEHTQTENDRLEGTRAHLAIRVEEQERAFRELQEQSRIAMETLEARLEAKSNEVIHDLERTYRHLLNQAQGDARHLKRICERLLVGAEAAFASSTWRAGRSLKRLVLALQGRGEGVTAEDYIRSLARQLDRWRSDVVSGRFTGPAVPPLAALWMRLNQRTGRLIAARWDESGAKHEPSDLSTRIFLSLLGAQSDIAVLPVSSEELARAPADILLARMSAVCRSDELDALIDRSRATGTPIICVADQVCSQRIRPGIGASASGRISDVMRRLLDAAKVIVVIDEKMRRLLVTAGYEDRILGPMDEVDHEAPHAEPSQADIEVWRAALARTDVKQGGVHSIASFDWSRLPIVREEDFESESYLSQNPDVMRGIQEGILANAFEHWDRYGRLEVQRGARTYCPGIVLDFGGLWHFSDLMSLRLRERIDFWPERPMISVVMPTWNTDPVWLAAVVDSVCRQIYPYWELCIADDGSTRTETLDYLGTLSDPRIKIRLLEHNGGIAAASNAALDLATGDFLALLDHDDTLAQDALYLVAETIIREQPDLIYSDEDKMTLDGLLTQPFHKPDYSPDQLLSQNYFSHLGVYRHDLVKAVGGFRPGFDGSQDYDLVLRCTGQTSKVSHIPHCLYHWRMVPGSTAARFESKDYAWDAGRRALEDALLQRGIAGSVDLGRYPGTYRVRRRIQGEPVVSIIIPFRDQATLLKTCLDSLLEHTRYPHFEILGVSNSSVELETYALMDSYKKRDGRVRFIRHDIPFNFSRINNQAAQQAQGKHLLFLNNDIEVLDGEWLESLLEHSQRPEVGCVGARLLYPDRSLQHAGVVIGLRTLAGHAHRGLADEAPGYFARPWIIHNVSALTAACVMLKRALFEDVNGFNENDLAVAFNDVDLCLRIREQGYLNVYTPYCALIHHESKSRGSEDTPEKQARFRREVSHAQKRHARALATGDPYYSPHLTIKEEDFAVLTELYKQSRPKLD